MNVGDRVRDKTRGIKGTIVQIEAAPGQTKRVLIQADAAPGSAPNAPHSRVWQMVTQVELIDREGKPVQGKPGAQLDAKGHRLDSAAHAVDGTGPVDPATGQPLGTATNYDSAGVPIGALNG